jgi:hypothetical protein
MHGMEEMPPQEQMFMPPNHNHRITWPRPNLMHGSHHMVILTLAVNNIPAFIKYLTVAIVATLLMEEQLHSTSNQISIHFQGMDLFQTLMPITALVLIIMLHMQHGMLLAQMRIDIIPRIPKHLLVNLEYWIDQQSAGSLTPALSASTLSNCKNEVLSRHSNCSPGSRLIRTCIPRRRHSTEIARIQ